MTSTFPVSNYISWIINGILGEPIQIATSCCPGEAGTMYRAMGQARIKNVKVCLLSSSRPWKPWKRATKPASKDSLCNSTPDLGESFVNSWSWQFLLLCQRLSLLIPGNSWLKTDLALCEWAVQHIASPGYRGEGPPLCLWSLCFTR